MANKTSIFLIRHGQSAGNAEGRFGGHSATPLSELGVSQAQCTAKLLAREKIAAVYSSDLARAMQTAEPLAELLGVEVIPVPEFRERNVGVLQGLTFQEAKKQFPDDYRALVHRNVSYVIKNGESYRQLLDRACDALRDIVNRHRGEKVAVYSHTGTICFLTLEILGALHPRINRTPWLVTSNCGINRIEFRGRNNIRILSINDTRHLSQISGNDAFASK